MSDIQVTSIDGNQINVTTGVVVGPLPSLQLAAGTGITIASGGGVSTISANLSELSVPGNLADLSNVNGTPATGQVLAWNGSSWGPADDQTGGSSNVSNLADLTDVSNATPANGQALVWNGSGWAGGNIPPGTTVNGLSGNVTLLAGDNINLSADGQNITISSDGGGFGGLSPDLLLRQATNLRITRNSLSELSLEWDSPIGYTGQYSVELIEVGVDANVTTSLPPTLNPDGSLSASISAGGVPLGGAVLFAANGSQAVDNQTQFFATIAENLSISGSNATISGAYLPAQFTEPGAVHLLAVGYDQSGYPVGRSDVSTVNVTQHGNPVAPEIVSFYGGNGTVVAELYSRQTPHQIGFYNFGQVAYFLEINQDANATTGWTRGDGVAADASDSVGDITLVSVSVGDDADYYARVVAANPLGEGAPRIS